MKKRFMVVLLVIVGIIAVGILNSLGGSNSVTRHDGLLVSANCTTKECTFIFKGSDVLSYSQINDQTYSPNYRFHLSGNWTVSINNKPNETINYLLELTNAQAIQGVVRVQ